MSLALRATLRNAPQAGFVLSQACQMGSQAARRVTMVNGITGELGTQVAIRAMKRGDLVIGCARNPAAAARLGSKGITILHTPEKAARTPEFWSKIFEQHAKDCEFKFVQTVGVGFASTLEDLRNANIKPVEASAQAFKAHETSMKDGAYVQLSTLATKIVPDSDYGSTKEEANRSLMAQQIRNTLILDVGYALPSVEEGEDFVAINSNHTYAPWQFTALPWPIRVHPVVGSGTQLLQPVDERDLAKAILNFTKGQVRVAAIGRQVISQENFMRFFAELAGRSFHPMHIPLEVAQLLAKHFPKGYFNPENGQALEVLENETRLFDPQPFEALVEERAKTLNEMYPSSNKHVIYTRPPIMEHAYEMVTTFATSAHARADTLKVIRDHGITLIRNYLTS